MAKKKSKAHIKQSQFRDWNITSIESHKRQGKTLIPPLNQLPGNIQFRSWIDSGIPDILWACILSAFLARERYLQLFRTVIISTRENIPDYENTVVTHNHLAQRSGGDFRAMFSAVLQDEEATKHLSSLCIIESLPDRVHWRKNLPEGELQFSWGVLAQAVAECFDHQSQAATDVRWLKVMHLAYMGKMRFPTTMKDLTEELMDYPNKGDMRRVRPFIRAMEMATRMGGGGAKGEPVGEQVEAVTRNSEAFWQECLHRTYCLMPEFNQDLVREAPTSIDEIRNIAEAISKHFYVTLTTSKADPRHDGAFGLVLYSFALAFEVIALGNGPTAGGRVILRSIAEAYITLHYLSHKDDETLWTQYRNYGSGQAKLAFLKNVREEEIPGFMNLNEIHSLANEDMWMEFRDIDLGSWAKVDLRSMSIESSCKDVYDKFYDWTSGFVHGQWMCVRETAFSTCHNPLHRLHRTPRPPKIMPSVSADIFKLLNLMLEDLNKLYPAIKVRLKSHKQRSTKRSKKVRDKGS